MAVQNEALPQYLNVERPSKSTHSSARQDWDRALRLAGVCVGVMCILQGTLNIVLRLYFTFQENTALLHTVCNNQSVDGNQHQTDGTMERNQLQIRYNNLAEERNQLQARFNTLTSQNDQLQARFNTLTSQNDQLQARFNTLTSQNDQLQARFNTLTSQNDQLQARFNTLTSQNDQLQARFNTLTSQNDQLQARFNTLTSQNDQLQARFNTLTSENQQLKTNYYNLQRDKDQLQTSCTNQANEKSGLQKKLADLDRSINVPGWIYFSSSTYLVSTERLSWLGAKQYCRDRRSDLVIINGREEQDFVEMIRRGEEAWIGLSDRGKEGDWKWVDGSALTTRFWSSMEPNNYEGGESCVTTGYAPTDGRPVVDVINTWNDQACSKTFHIICERKIPRDLFN
ncbi:C-type lectin domain family 10 member A isoform X2 [Astyanax mexicanus]|uniref:C-type lectin domain family 10 member A isoform X2 n=1 Tax=Astyanax mexicanus TaxID=7994 RepID=UPI0020CADA5D|nr:C-type lectin domain family 10 member A isoform X2 [Astyanax mexicanus]